MTIAHALKRRFKKIHYLLIFLLLLAAIAVSGWLLNRWMTKSQVTDLPFNSLESKNDNDLDKNFATAVNHMQRGEYEQALKLWHQIMLINPDVPEVKVNMGFSLFEVGRFDTARKFFSSAMEQNPFQANAYYGLAITSEKIGDLEAAMGAMKSFIHLAKDDADQAFIRKARSALWEWETQLKSDQE